MAEVVTKRDLIEQNLDKVFPEGPVAAEPEATSLGEVMARPGGMVTPADLDAAKALAMAGPLVPEFVRGNPGTMLAAMLMARRFAKYDERTNSWITFDPIAVASCMYLVESGGRQSVGYTSQFIGAVLEGFVPWASRMRYRYEGEGEDRTCTASAMLKGDPLPFEYTTPTLRLITPKKSPLWQSDPDRQLAYFARRAWARLYVPGVLLGIYDVDELEGDERRYRGPDHAKDVTNPTAAAALHQRLAHAAAQNGEAEPEGFHPDAVERGIKEEHAPQSAREGQGRDSGGEGSRAKGKSGKRTGKAAAGKAREQTRTTSLVNPRHLPGAKVVKAVADRAERQPDKSLPQTAAQYRKHLVAWLAEYDTEQAINERWSSEKKLREMCNVTFEEGDEARELKNQRVQQVRK